MESAKVEFVVCAQGCILSIVAITIIRFLLPSGIQPHLRRISLLSSPTPLPPPPPSPHTPSLPFTIYYIIGQHSFLLQGRVQADLRIPVNTNVHHCMVHC